MLRALLFFGFSTLLASQSVFAADKLDAYQLSPGDSILVSVWREDTLQKEVRVLPDGSITFPLAGRVEVSGHDVEEASKRIAAKLKDFIPDPNVSIVITGIEGNRVYVVGKVPKSGPIVMTGPVTVLQALSMSGGLDKFADEGAIQVLRRKGSTDEILSVNYKHLISGRDMKTNFQLRAGDTLLVP
jgi:polysaccharide biosynthesis/export protein